MECVLMGKLWHSIYTEHIFILTCFYFSAFLLTCFLINSGFIDPDLPHHYPPSLSSSLSLSMSLTVSGVKNWR